MNPSEPSKSNGRSKAIAIVLILLFLLIGGCVFHHLFRRKGKVVEEHGGTGGGTPTGTPAARHAAEVPPTPTPPPYEKWFMDNVKRFEDNPPPDTDKERIRAARSDRALFISRALPGVHTITDWKGTFRKLQSVPGGKAALVIELPEPTILVQTWGDPISDATAGTLIDEHSELYKKLKSLKPGTPVSFDGEFLESADDWCLEGSKSPHEGLLSPKFIVKFSAVRSLRD
jgi:hypothetical protein